MTAIIQFLSKKDRDINDAINTIEELNQKYLTKLVEDSKFVDLGDCCDPLVLYKKIPVR